MNVKQGDLVRYAGNAIPNAYGWIGTAVKRKDCLDDVIAWIVEPPIYSGIREDKLGIPRSGGWVIDQSLRPLRDNPGTDETLIYAGLPNKAPVPSKLKERS